MIEKDIVIPGDQLGVIEEFSPQKNCFADEEGNVFTLTWGKKVVDKEKHQVSVYPSRRIFTPRRGSIVLGYVTEIRRQNATLKLSFFKVGKTFENVKTKYMASLSIMNLSNRYIKNMYDGVRPGDWIIAKINKIEFNGSISVSVYGSRDLGVIYASCYKCAKEVSKVIKRNLLRCTHCGTTQTRVLSSDYPITDSSRFF